MALSIDDVAGAVYKYQDINNILADIPAGSMGTNTPPSVVDNSAKRLLIYENIRIIVEAIVQSMKDGVLLQKDYPDTGDYVSDNETGLEIDGSSGIFTVTSSGGNVK